NIMKSVFFFSSRRRHTRSYGDWSSDVCSSDLCDGAAARSAGEKRDGVCYRAAFGSASRQPVGKIARQSHDHAGNGADGNGQTAKIGRASCRERVEMWVGGGELRRKKRRRNKSL